MEYYRDDECCCIWRCLVLFFLRETLFWCRLGTPRRNSVCRGHQIRPEEAMNDRFFVWTPCVPDGYICKCPQLSYW